MENSKPQNKPVFTFASLALSLGGAVAPAVGPLIRFGGHFLRFLISLFTFGAVFPDATVSPQFELPGWPVYAGLALLSWR